MENMEDKLGFTVEEINHAENAIPISIENIFRVGVPIGAQNVKNNLRAFK